MRESLDAEPPTSPLPPVVEAIFGALDADGDGYLQAAEIKAWALENHAIAGADDWAEDDTEQWAGLCASYGVADPAQGFGRPAFGALHEAVHTAAAAREAVENAQKKVPRLAALTEARRVGALTEEEFVRARERVAVAH